MAPSSSMSDASLRAEFERDALVHTDALYRTALRLTRNEASAQDLVQDSLVRALRFYGQFEPGTNLKAWLFRILMNTFINRYRRAGLERGTVDNSGASVGEGVISTSAVRALVDPESAALRPLVAEELSAAIDALPEDFRAVVLLADVEELAYKEIADILSIPIGTVMSRLHRGRKILRGALVSHAIALGIVSEEEATRADEVHEPVSLDAYRARRERGAS